MSVATADEIVRDLEALAQRATDAANADPALTPLASIARVLQALSLVSSYAAEVGAQKSRAVLAELERASLPFIRRAKKRLRKRGLEVPHRLPPRAGIDRASHLQLLRDCICEMLLLDHADDAKIAWALYIAIARTKFPELVDPGETPFSTRLADALVKARENDKPIDDAERLLVEALVAFGLRRGTAHNWMKGAAKIDESLRATVAEAVKVDVTRRG